MVERARFEELVADALDSLPQWVLDRLENVEVIVEDRPPRDDPNLLGRYHGVPLTRRGAFHSGATLPGHDHVVPTDDRARGRATMPSSSG